jgi:indole-3-glycerol phosphate synthase
VSGLLSELVRGARERARRLPAIEPGKRANGPSFLSALQGKDRLDVVAEFKRRSPSLGAIAEPDLETQVARYERAGAAAVSVLTEPTRFGGSTSDLERAASAVQVPVLMKDFVVDPAQVREAARIGASAVLLIVRCLSRSELDELVSACSHYRLTPLVECRSEDEIEVASGFDSAVLGVNNRDLETLEIDTALAPRLLAAVPLARVVVAESGYASARDVSAIEGLADAVLIGSALMRHEDPARLIEEIRR